MPMRILLKLTALTASNSSTVLRLKQRWKEILIQAICDSRLEKDTPLESLTGAVFLVRLERKETKEGRRKSPFLFVNSLFIICYS
jgi:hypothetical protein